MFCGLAAWVGAEEWMPHGEDITGAYARVVASDYVLLGMLLACVSPWLAFTVCTATSLYLRFRVDPRFGATIVILNEALVASVGVPFANLVAPLQPSATATTKWVHTPNGVVPVDIEVSIHSA